MQKIHLNVDVGEGLDNESAILPFVSACNIACGGHAGNEQTIVKVLELAKKYNVAVGAHPSYPDQQNFGRKIMDISRQDLQKSIEQQLILFKNLAAQKNMHINHVKPHGALYNIGAKDKVIAEIIVKAIEKTIGKTIIFVPYNSVIEEVAIKNNFKIMYEVFCDRNYNDDLSLVNRTAQNAIIDNFVEVKNHVQFLLQQKVKTTSHQIINIKADTFCIHGDHANTIEIIQKLSKIYQIEKLPNSD